MTTAVSTFPNIEDNRVDVKEKDQDHRVITNTSPYRICVMVKRKVKGQSSSQTTYEHHFLEFDEAVTINIHVWEIVIGTCYTPAELMDLIRRDDPRGEEFLTELYTRAQAMPRRDEVTYPAEA